MPLLPCSSGSVGYLTDPIAAAFSVFTEVSSATTALSGPRIFSSSLKEALFPLAGSPLVLDTTHLLSVPVDLPFLSISYK